MPERLRTVAFAAALIIACGAVGAAVIADDRPARTPHRSSGQLVTPAPHSTPRASTARDVPRFSTVGALFRGSSGGVHACTASVIASTSRNTIITAAHCVQGDGTGLVFTPSYRDGHSPEGDWRVTGAYVMPAWQHHQDPSADFAVLTVAPRSINGRSERLADVTGAETLGGPPPVGTTVTVVAYNHGRDDEPVTCDAKVFRVQGYPTFACHGFVDGSSGSPWLTFDATGQATIHGVIGGLEQGGCHEYRSHTAVFDADVSTLVGLAERASAPDVVVAPKSPTC